MKILWLEPEPPIPPLTGGRERTRRFLDYLSRRHAIHLATFAAPEDAPGLADLGAQLAGLTAVPYPPRPENPFAPMQRAVQSAARRFKPECYHIHGLDLWPYAPPDTRRVLDLQNAPGLLQSRLAAIQPGIPLLSGWRNRRAQSRRRRQETNALAQATAVIAASSADKAAILGDIGGAARPVVVVPNGVSLDAWPPAAEPPDPATILFPGALNWLPNIDAIQVLARQVWPLVQARVPQAKLIIAGRRPDPAVARLAEADTAVTLIPDPPDMVPIFVRATVVAAPLRAAAGTRLKILQALATGRPVVSTPIGAEGLGLENGRHLLIAPLVVPFANALIDLLTNPNRRQRLSRAGRAIAPRFDWQNYLPVLDTVYHDSG